MRDNLINLAKEHAGSTIINNLAIANEKNDDAIRTVAGGIMDVLKNQITEGNLTQMMSLFNSGNANSNPILSQITQQVTISLSGKLGINPQEASKASSGLIPIVLNNLISKTNDPRDSSFDINSIMSNLGGNAGGMGSVASSIKSIFGSQNSFYGG